MIDILTYVMFGLCAYFALAIPLAVMIGRLIRYGSLEKPDQSDGMLASTEDGTRPAWSLIHENSTLSFAYARSMRDDTLSTGFGDRPALSKSSPGISIAR